MTITWLAVAILALTGRRRAAAAIASAPLALDLASLLAVFIHLNDASSGGLPVFLYVAAAGPVALASLTVCSLAFSAGPRHGLAIVGRWRACLMIAGLAAGFAFPEVVLVISLFRPWFGSGFNLLSALAIAAAAVATCVRAPAGGRVAVLIAAGPLLGFASSFPFTDTSAGYEVSVLVNLLLALLVWPVAIASWKGRVSRA